MLYGAIFVVFVLMIRLDARSSTVNPVTSLNFKVQKVHKGTIFCEETFREQLLKSFFICISQCEAHLNDLKNC